MFFIVAIGCKAPINSIVSDTVLNQTAQLWAEKEIAN